MAMLIFKRQRDIYFFKVLAIRVAGKLSTNLSYLLIERDTAHKMGNQSDHGLRPYEQKTIVATADHHHL